jgi:MFS transporter, PAT family, beta-lactamase induction signal transducer AmpG
MRFLSEIKLATTESFKAIFTSRKMLVMFLLGFSSGLPFLLTLSTLTLWFASYDISMQDLGYLSLITFPYAIKFLWAPLMDRYTLPFLGRRHGWILAMQVCIIFMIILLSFYSPDTHPLTIAGICVVLCFFSASQDIAINAYQADILLENERAIGGTISVLGYRIGIIISGTVALFIAFYSSWNTAYLSMSGFMIIGIVGILIAPHPDMSKITIPKNLFNAVILPFKEFFTRLSFKSALLVLLIIIIYKLGDALAFSMNSAFFLKGLNFNLIEIAIAYKTNATIFAILGSVVGAIIITRIGIYKGILYFSIIMACANLMYLLLALVGKSYVLMSLSVAVEYFAGGLGTSAFIALLLSLCNQSFSATQFAIFSSIDSIGRIFIGPLAGFTVENYSWATLFFLSFVIGLITTLIIYLAKKPLCKMGNLKINT